jgi:hypothetical protein
MKKIMSIVFLVMAVGCGVNSSSNMSIDPKDIKIIRKGDLCFGIVATRASFSTDTTGLGMAYIPCEKLK